MIGLMRTYSLLLTAILLIGSAFAQNTGDLPAAPSTQRPFPGDPPRKATPPAQQPAQAPAEDSSGAPALETLPPPATASQPPATEKPAPETKAAQPPAKPSTGGGPTPADEALTRIVHDVNEVNLVFTATDKHGHFVKDLKKDDVTVTDDGKAVKDLLRFEGETNLPLRVGLLIDASNSIRDRFRFEQESAVEFLNQIIRRNSDEAFVMGFDSTPDVTQDFTDDTAKLSTGVRRLRPGGGTALFDALYDASKERLMTARSSKGATRRAIILLTDGDDNQSRVTREQAIEMAQRAEVVIYAISTNITGTKSPGDKVLERFAAATGGRVFFPYKMEDVTNAFTEIQDELRSQYHVSYKPPDFVPDGRFRAVLIDVPRNKNVHIRTRKGYYAQKDTQSIPSVPGK
jgi:Ca-activated chloride channel family protein